MPAPPPAHAPPRRRLRRAPALTLLVAAACGGGDLTQPPVTQPPLPRVLTDSVTSNPNSVLSAAVVFTAEHAESARVVYRSAAGAVDSTPYVRVDSTGGGLGGRVVVLGLRPSTAYAGVLELAGPGGVFRSDTLAFAAGALPELLQHVTITTTGTGSGGFTLTEIPIDSTALFAFAFDSAGTIRWYRRIDDPNIGGELKLQRNGHYTIYVGASFGSQRVPGHYLEFTPAGDSVRGFTVAPPSYVDDHELWITTGPDGQDRIHFFTYDHRTTDLTAIGGSATADLAGHQLVRLRADGTPEFVWNAWDHLTLADWIEPPMPGPVDPNQPDFDHPNSIDFDRDGNYIVSFRNLGQVMKIDAQTGAILWRLGGAANQFTFVNDPFGGFSAQHYARLLPDGHLLLYDNGTRHQPPETRVVEYALDFTAKTATMVWQFRHAPPIYTPFVGSVQRLANGNTAIGYGLVAHATEVTPAGVVAWEADVRLEGRTQLVYRMVRIASLYRYAEP